MSAAPMTRSVLLHEPGRAELVERPLAPPGPDEVQVAVGAAGVCGSDVELYDGTRPRGYRRYPVVPGHEWAGTVSDIGEDVAGVRVGDRVVSEGFRWCGRCARCREGATNLCLSRYAETGFTEPGAFSDYVTVPGRLVHRLPDDGDLEQAALLEPAACVAAGLLAEAPAAGARVAVVGAGTLGLLAVELLGLHSPAELTVVEPVEKRRGLALSLGATEAVAPPPDGEALELEADLVVETAGKAPALPLALGAARRGGTAILLGISGAGPVELDADLFSVRHLGVQGVFGAGSAAWKHAVSLFSAGLLRLAPLITHRLRLEGYEEALGLLGGADVGKVLLLPNGPAPARDG